MAYPPRGMNREEAARYIGVSPRKFDELVVSGRMPKPKRIDGRAVWDRVGLDVAFADFPAQSNEYQQMLERSGKA